MRAVGALVVLFILMSATPAAAVSYEEIRDNAATMTKAQFIEYSRSLLGEQVIWTGTLLDVGISKYTYAYLLKMDLDGNGNLDLAIEAPKHFAMMFKKGRQYKFTGVIERMFVYQGRPIIRLINVLFLNLNGQ